MGVFLAPFQVFADEDCLTLGVGENAAARAIAPNVSMALGTAGICHEIRFLAEKRVSILLEKGKIDGDILRVSFFREFVETPVEKANVPVARASGYLIVKDPSIQGLDDLRGEPVGVHKGQVWQQRLVGNWQAVESVETDQQLVGMLASGRVKGFLIDAISWRQFEAAQADWIKIPVSDLSGYTWLRADRAQWIPAIEQAYRDYQQNVGSFMTFRGGLN